MAKQIKNEEIFSNDLFVKTKQDAEALLQVIVQMLDAFKNLGTETQKSFKGTGIPQTKKELDEFAQAEKNVKTATDEVNKVKQKENKLIDQLKKATDEEVKGRLRLQKAQKEQRDRLKALIVEEAKEAGTLEKLAARNNLLRQEREKLNLETETGRIRLKQINAEIDRNNNFIKANSDQLKQQKLNVGNYAGSVKDALAQTGFFSGALFKLNQLQATSKAILTILNVERKKAAAATAEETAATVTNTAATEANAAAEVQETATQAAQTAAEIAGTEATAASTTATEVNTAATLAQDSANKKAAVSSIGFGKALRTIGTSLKATGIGLLIAALAGLVGFFTKTQEGADSLQRILAGVGAVFEVIIDRVAKFGKAVTLFFSGDFSEAARVASEAFTGVGKAISDNIDLQIELTKQTQRTRDAVNDFIVTRAKLREEIAKSKLAAEEEGKSVKERIALLKEANAAESELAELQRELILQQFAQAAQITDLEQARKRLNELAEEGQKLTRDEIGLTDTSEEQRQKALELVAQFIEAREEEFKRQKENATKIRGLILKDAAEREKIEDAIEKRRLERIENDRERELALAEFGFKEEVQAAKEKAAELGLGQSLLNKEIESLTETHRVKVLGINQKFDAEEEKRRKDFEAKQAADVQKRINTINQIEQELIEAQIQRIGRQVDEETNKIIESIQTGEKTSNQEVLRLIDEQFNLRARKLEDAADFRIQTENLTAEEVELINAQLQRQLEENERQRLAAVQVVNGKILDEQKALNKQIREDATATANSIVDGIEDVLQKRIDVINKELEASEQREEALKELAARGSEDAINNLAFEQRRKAELERERERQIKKQQRLALGQAAFNTYAAKTQAGDKNAVFNTIRDIGLLNEFIKNLPLFYEGTEHVGKSLGAPDLPGRDGHIIRVDGPERVVDGANNAKMAGLSNDELAEAAQIYKMGTLPAVNYVKSSTQATAYNPKEIAEAIAKSVASKIPNQKMFFDEYQKMMYFISENAAKRETNKIKVRPHRHG